MIQDIIFSALQAVIMILISPLLTGIIRKLKAYMQHRKGNSVFQPYRDLIKLFKKDEVVSRHSTWLFRAVPYVCLSSMLLLALMIPFMFVDTLAPYGDLIAMVYIFTMYRFMMVLGGLEGGSVFGGMGSSREMMMSVLIEPALLLSVMALAGLTKAGTAIGDIPPAIIDMGIAALTPTLILATSSFFITLMAENARIPFDNPATHLELTMVHEGMLLEYSGRGLGLMEFSSMLRLTIFMSILGSMFFPWGIATDADVISLIIGFAAIMAKLLIIVVIIAVIESYIAKFRLFRLPNLLTASFVLSLLALISLYIL
ncbi:MAG: NADH-quinone oxidoreductase subunit H [Candidatus Methanoplasma sp.]|nr:NADH-quinone oxidoreductase subunit H [Candidatus Methanoplasma sp.]